MFPLAGLLFCFVFFLSVENKHPYLKIFSKVLCPPEPSVELRPFKRMEPTHMLSIEQICIVCGFYLFQLVVLVK